jgi:hypothetical protein
VSGDDLPNFFVVGAMKAGTTSLAKYLGQHPDVFMCEPKEPRFFMEAGTWENGESWYRGLFAEGREHLARGEATTGYSKLPVHAGVPERISSLVPEARIVYLVRAPLHRIRSQYVHNVMHVGLRGPLRDALANDRTYVEFSRYAYQLRPYLDTFGSDRVLVLANEQLRDDRTTTLDRIFQFLGVDARASDIELTAVSNTSAAKLDQLREGGLAAKGAGVLRRAGLTKLAPARLRRRAHGAITRPVVDEDDLVLAPDIETAILEELAEDRSQLERIVPGVTDWWDDEP